MPAVYFPIYADMHASVTLFVKGAKSVLLAYGSVITATYSTAVSRTGTRSIKHVVPASPESLTGGKNYNSGSYLDIDVIEGASYAVSAWTRAENRPANSNDGGEAVWIHNCCHCTVDTAGSGCDQNTRIQKVTWGAGGQGEWTKVGVRTSAMLTSSMRIHLYSYGPVGGGHRLLG